MCTTPDTLPSHRHGKSPFQPTPLDSLPSCVSFRCSCPFRTNSSNGMSFQNSSAGHKSGTLPLPAGKLPHTELNWTYDTYETSTPHAFAEECRERNSECNMMPRPVNLNSYPLAAGIAPPQPPVQHVKRTVTCKRSQSLRHAVAAASERCRDLCAPPIPMGKRETLCVTAQFIAGIEVVVGDG